MHPFRILLGLIIDAITLIIIYKNIGLTFYEPYNLWISIFSIFIGINIIFLIVLFILAAVYISNGDQDELIESIIWKFSFFFYKVSFFIAEIFLFSETYTQSESYKKIQSFQWYEIVLMVWEIIQAIMETFEFIYLIILVKNKKFDKEMKKIM
jgi:hypothetical protein